MRYNSIRIRGFRGIKDLKVEGFDRFNLIVGKNGCGKTSILEAVELVSGMSNQGLIYLVQSQRGVFTYQDQDLDSIFYSQIQESEIDIDGYLDEEERHVLIKPLLSQNQSLPYQMEIRDSSGQPQVIVGSGANRPVLAGLAVSFWKSAGKQYSYQISLQRGSPPATPPDYRENLSHFMLAPRNIPGPGQLEAPFDEIIRNKQMDIVLEALREVEPRIADLRMLTNNRLYVDIGAARLLPLNIAGDGTRKLAAILAAVASQRDGIVLIDEIENGLHHSSMRVLWRAILKACARFNVQLFATTHSYECISALRDSKAKEDSIKIFRVERVGDEHRIVTYAAEEIDEVIDTGLEVR